MDRTVRTEGQLNFGKTRIFFIFTYNYLIIN